MYSGYGSYARKCKNCGTDLDRWVRSNKETCSDSCRKAWSRRKDNVKKEWNNALRSLSHLRRMVKEYPDLAEEINGYLRHVQGECRDILLLSDKEEQARTAMLNDLAIRRDR